MDDYEVHNLIDSVRNEMSNMRYDLEASKSDDIHDVKQEIRQNYSDLSISINSLAERLSMLEDQIDQGNSSS